MMTATATKEISSITAPDRLPYQKTLDYRYGFDEGIGEAVFVTHKYDMLSARMAGALESINTDDVEVKAALGDDAIFLIQSALRVYRAMGEQQTVEEVGS